MLHQKEERTLTTFGTQETKTFSIDMNDKSFSILFDRLYSDPIRAIIRELWANAYDSHNEAGRGDRPFYCHIPTVFDPSFTVRDYGVSLDHDGVMNLYTTAFRSTKDKSNVGVGKFGLGSKSPFAYTDTFTVTAFLNGECRVYSAYMDADGIPTIALMATSATDEENGLAVSFPVDPDDVHAFYQKAREVARGFDVRPETNQPDIFRQLDELDIIVEGPGWKVMSKSWGVENAMFVRQGCVIYPVDKSRLFPGISYDNITSALFEMNTLIDMPIGSVDITPNREALRYDDVTTKNLQDKILEIGKQAVGQIQDKIDACKTFAEVIKTRNEVLESGRALNGHIFRNMRWRGRKVSGSVSIDDRGRKPYRDIRVMVMSTSDFIHGRTYRSNGFAGRFEPGNFVNINPARVVIYVEDTTGDRVKHSGLRLKEDFQSRITGVGDDRPTEFVWVKGDLKSRDFKRLLVSLGRPDCEIVDLAKCPEPVKQTRSANARRSVKCKEINALTVREDEVSIDSDEENIVYIAKQRNDFVDHRGTLSTSTLVRWVGELKKSGHMDALARVVIVPATHKRLIEKNKDTWKNFFDIVDAYLDAKDFSAVGIKAHMYSLRNDGAVSNRAMALATTLSAMGELPRARTPFREFVARIRVMDRLAKRAGDDKVMLEILEERRTIEAAKLREKASPKARKIMSIAVAQDLTEGFEETYPLAFHIIPSYASDTGDTVTKHLLQYIDLIDTAA